MREKIEIWLNLNKEELDSSLKRATQESIDSDPNDEDMKDNYLYPNMELRTDEFYVEDKSDFLHISGNLFSFGKDLGFISFDIPLNQDIAKDIIDRYIKKLQKLKTVLEATKD